MSHIFISYSHEYRDYAQKLVKATQTAGLAVWFDERIESGDRWWRTIAQAIRESSAVIVIMTPEAEASEWVEREILVAQKHNKPIFPVLLKGQEFDLLITTQYEDVRGSKLPDADFFNRLRQAASGSTPRTPTVRPKPLSVGPAVDHARRKICDSLVSELELIGELDLQQKNEPAIYQTWVGRCSVQFPPFSATADLSITLEAGEKQYIDDLVAQGWKQTDPMRVVRELPFNKISASMGYMGEAEAVATAIIEAHHILGIAPGTIKTHLKDI